MMHQVMIVAADVSPVIRSLIEVRLAWGLEQQDVAARIGVQKSYLCQMETGAKIPGFKMLSRWAEVLGYDLGLSPKDAASQ